MHDGRAQRKTAFADQDDTVSLYFGTTTGQLWIVTEGGEPCDCLFDSLSPIHNVKVAVV